LYRTRGGQNISEIKMFLLGEEEEEEENTNYPIKRVSGPTFAICIEQEEDKRFLKSVFGLVINLFLDPKSWKICFCNFFGSNF
jgi:hypothetical protein